MDRSWLSLAVEISGPVAVALLAWLARLAAVWIRSHVANAEIAAVLLRLNDTVAAVVGDLAQREVAALKSASADGKLSPAEVAELRDVAWQSVKRLHGPDGWAAASRSLGLTNEQLIDLILAKVEARVAVAPRSTLEGK